MCSLASRVNTARVGLPRGPLDKVELIPLGGGSDDHCDNSSISCLVRKPLSISLWAKKYFPEASFWDRTGVYGLRKTSCAGSIIFEPHEDKRVMRPTSEGLLKA